MAVADHVGHRGPVGMRVPVHRPGRDDEPVAHDAQHLLQPGAQQRVGPQQVQVGQGLEEVRGRVDVLVAERRPDRIRSRPRGQVVG